MGHYDSDYEYDDWRASHPAEARRLDEENKKKEQKRQLEKLNDERTKHGEREYKRFNTPLTYFIGTKESFVGPFNGTLLEAVLHKERVDKNGEILTLTRVVTDLSVFDEEGMKKRIARGW